MAIKGVESSEERRSMHRVRRFHVHLPRTSYYLEKDPGRVTGQSGKLSDALKFELDNIGRSPPIMKN